MARQPRIALAGKPHFVVQSTAARSGAFVDDEDRRLYLLALFESSRDAGVAVHAYALADHRVQLLATPDSAEALGRFMQRLGRRYVAAFNRRHQTAGRLWASRFGSAALLSERYLLTALLTIEQLPVRDGCTTAAGDWHWSSAAHHIGSRPDTRMVDIASYWTLGNTPFERQARYANLLTVILESDRSGALEAAARAGWPLGDKSEVEAVERLASGTSLKPRPRGRPRVAA